LAIGPGDIKVIPLNKEQSISISKIITISNGGNFEIRFLDSFRFMPSVLDTLASNLDSEQIVYVKIRLISGGSVERQFYPDVYISRARTAVRSPSPSLP